MKLTERKIEALAVERGGKDRLVFDDAQRGLAVRVTASGGRTYLAQYTLHGQKWRVPLGSCVALSLADAREAAAAIMGDVAKGRNPAAERKEAAKAEQAKRAGNRLALRVLIDDWNRLHLAGRRPRYAAEAVRALHYAFVDALDSAAEEPDRAAIMPALDALTRRRARQSTGGTDKPKGAAMTGRTAAYGRAAFAWAVKRGAVQANPFADLPVAKSIAKRERVLSDDEIGEIWRAAGNAASPYGAIVRLLILTGQRRGEVAGMAWREISDDLSTWTQPGERTKNGAAHIVPLSAQARDLLAALLPGDAKEAGRALADRRAGAALALPGAVGTPFAGWSKAKSALDKAITDARAKGRTAAEIRRAGVIGLGAMGLQMARHMAAKGFDVAGTDIDDEAMRRAGAHGVRLCGSAAEVGAHAEVVIVMVATDAQVDGLVRASGLLDALAPGAGSVIAVASSVAPETCRELAGLAGERGIGLIDTPVVLGQEAANNGTLTVYAGGEERWVARAKPVLAAFAEKIIHVGAVGNGQIAKTMNNMLLWACMCANFEVLTLAKALGADVPKLIAALEHGSGANWSLSRWGKGTGKWAEKDMDVALELAQAARVPMPLSGLVDQLVKSINQDRMKALLG